MDIYRLLVMFRSILVLSIVLLFIGCSGGGSDNLYIGASSIEDEGSNSKSNTYSNASLEGVWIITSANHVDNNERPYMIADGEGKITDFGAFDMNTQDVGEYSVEDDGSLSVILYCLKGDSDITIEGNLTSDKKLTIITDDDQELIFTRIDSRAICEGKWTGTITITELEITTSYDISFGVDAEGVVSSFIGFQAPVTGNMFSINGYLSSFFRTGEDAPYDQFSIVGTFDYNTIEGIFIANQTDLEVSVSLHRME